MDTSVEGAVSSHDDDTTALLRGLARLIEDRGVAILRGVHGADMRVAAGPYATLGLTLQPPHDHVLLDVCGEQLFVQPLVRALAVLPPSLRTGPDDVAPVDYERSAHLKNL